MSRKNAELSAGLVAVKGAALPAGDMPPRATTAGATTAGAATGGANTRGADARNASAGQGREALAPLNFRIPASFRREFKTYAANHDLKLNELLRLAFDAYRKQQGN